MPKRTSKRTSGDVVQNAFRVVQESVGEAPKPKSKPEKPKITKSLISQVMSELGRKGGKKGGKRRLETMTPHERSRIALKAAQARWSKEQHKTDSE
jgi:hypothetical protein